MSCGEATQACGIGIFVASDLDSPLDLPGNQLLRFVSLPSDPGVMGRPGVVGLDLFGEFALLPGLLLRPRSFTPLVSVLSIPLEGLLPLGDGSGLRSCSGGCREPFA